MAELFQLQTKNKNEGKPYQYSLPTGFPSPALDAMKPRISLDDMIVENPLSTFYFRYDCDALVGACIPRNSIFMVDRTLPLENRDLIVCSLDTKDYTAGFYKVENGKKWLVLANKSRKSIEIVSNEFLFFGVVAWYFKSTRKSKTWLR